MATLIVKPIDLAAPGSYRERKRFMRVIAQLQDAQASRQSAEVLRLMQEVDEMLVPRLKTPDGSSVEEALDGLSANDFDRLLSAIAFENSVGEASGVPSENGTEGTPRKSRRGK